MLSKLCIVNLLHFPIQLIVKIWHLLKVIYFVCFAKKKKKKIEGGMYFL